MDKKQMDKLLMNRAACTWDPDVELDPYGFQVYFDHSIMDVDPNNLEEVFKHFTDKRFSDKWKTIISRLVYDGNLKRAEIQALKELNEEGFEKLELVLDDMAFEGLNDKMQERLDDFKKACKEKYEILNMLSALE